MKQAKEDCSFKEVSSSCLTSPKARGLSACNLNYCCVLFFDYPNSPGPWHRLKWALNGHINKVLTSVLPFCLMLDPNGGSKSTIRLKHSAQVTTATSRVFICSGCSERKTPLELMWPCRPVNRVVTASNRPQALC